MTKRSFSFWVVVFLLLGGGLRLWKAGSTSLWLDEILSLQIVQTPLRDWWYVLATDACTPPLHYLVERLSVLAFGVNELGTRLPSIVFGTATIPLLMFYCDALFGPASGIIAGLMLTLSPIHIAYSQEARPYALMAFLVLVSFCLLCRALRLNSKSSVAAYVISLIALPYTHHWGIFVVLSQFLYLVVYERRTDFFRNWFVWVVGIFTLAYAVWLPSLWLQSHSGTLAGMSASSRHDLGRLYRAYASVRFGVGETELQQPLWLRNIGMTLFLIPTATVVFSLFRATSGHPTRLFLFGTLVTNLIPYFISFKFPIMQVDRYPIIVFPIFIAFLASGARYGRRSLWIAWVGCWLVYSSIAIYPLYTTWVKSTSGNIAHFLQSNLGPADAVWFISGTDALSAESIPVNYYYAAPLFDPQGRRKNGRVVLIYNGKDSNAESKVRLAREVMAHQRMSRRGEIHFGSKVLQFFYHNASSVQHSIREKGRHEAVVE